MAFEYIFRLTYEIKPNAHEKFSFTFCLIKHLLTVSQSAEEISDVARWNSRFSAIEERVSQSHQSQSDLC